MNQNSSISTRWQGVILALVVVLYGLLAPAYCQDIASQPFSGWQPITDGAVLLMQQPDAYAGSVTPDVGVHYVDVGSEVLLTAIPEAGYYFVYWIGDVSDPTAISTTIYMDAPKIVLAVFARSEFAFSIDETITVGGGGGGLRSSAGDYGRQGFWGSNPWVEPPSQRRPTPPPPTESDEFPVPMPPVPEPTTLLLLGLGSMLLIRRSHADYLWGTKR